jgi:hypothetical protein
MGSIDELRTEAVRAREPSFDEVRRRLPGDWGAADCPMGMAVVGGEGSNMTGVLVLGSCRLRLCVMVSSGGVRALAFATIGGPRGGIVVEVGRCCGAEPVEEVVGVWVNMGRELGLSRPGGRGGGGSLWRLSIPVPGISGSSLMGPSVRRLGFIIRLGAPPDPMTSG